MRCAYLISVGNELLNGQRIDTNSPWLQEKLLALGIQPAGVSVVPDEKDRIAAALNEASGLGDIVILTGGLGPTDDDLTRQGLAEFLGQSLELREDLLQDIERYFKRRGLPMASTNRVQAYLPAGTDPIPNSRGTAPGIFAERKGKLYFCLPGVPYEMKTMFEDFVCSRLIAQADRGVILAGKIRCFGIGESTIAETLGELMQRGRNPLVNSTAHMGDIILHVIANAADADSAMKMIDQDRGRICQLLGDAVYGFEEQTLPEVIGILLKKHDLKLAVAESCTGGLLGSMITDVPGSSEYFLAGWVTYSNEAKVRDLGVSAEVIAREGAVSDSIARAMAEGAALKSGADIAVGITGIAGPDGGTEQKPVGLVYIGLFFKGKTEVQECRFSPTGRQAVRHRAALTALNWIRLKLKV